VLVAIVISLAMLMPWSGIASTAPRTSPSATGLEVAAGGPISNLQFSFQPSTASGGSQVTVNVSWTGGTPGFFLWFNNTPPGCTPPSNPQTSPSNGFTINCRPTNQGVYTAHLDVVDSASPASKASSAATLTVTSNGNNNGNGSNNNSNNGGGGNGSFSFPSGLFTIALLGGVAFLGALVAIAAGTIATAAMVSRRLRQLNETLQKLVPPTEKPKPPT
jgi:hypothetical protein